MPLDLLAFDDDSPALISQALRRYDASNGGPQTFEGVMFRNSEGGPLTIERKETFERTVAGRRLKLTRWSYALSDFELDVLAGPIRASTW
jgi:hypothetical protein